MKFMELFFVHSTSLIFQLFGLLLVKKFFFNFALTGTPQMIVFLCLIAFVSISAYFLYKKLYEIIIAK